MAQTVTTTSEQDTVTPGKSGVGGSLTAGEKGARNQAILNTAFAESPIYAGSAITVGEGASAMVFDYSSPEKLKAAFIDNVTKGTISDAQFGLENHSLDFQNSAPNLETQFSSAEGAKPANGFVPNVNSPGEGNMEAADKPATVEALASQVAKLDKIKEKDGNAPFVGEGIVTRANLGTQGQNVADRLVAPITD